jgi:phage repressor protein C with HTH and peptisase S24 domain/DNA-binding XRE family transcriptional regulator
MSLGKIIRQRRRERQLTQDQVARRVEISKAYLSNIETDCLANPPSPRVIAGLEQALAFTDGELKRVADLARTPPEVRDEHERLAARVERLQSILGHLLESGSSAQAGEGGAIDVEAVLAEAGLAAEGIPPGGKDLPSQAGNVDEVVAPTRAVPIINKVAAGYPHHFTDLDYPPSIADDYVRCPDVHDPYAFAARVVGDSMSPAYVEGDIVIFSPGRQPSDGDDCFVRFADDSATTFKRLRLVEGGRLRLDPVNDVYDGRTYEPDEITGLWPAVMKIQKLK